MVWHQTVGVNEQPEPLRGFPQDIEKSLAVPIIAKRGLALVTARHDMIGRALKLDPNFPWHGELQSAERLSVNCQGLSLMHGHLG
jgi:hypothetical protein